MQLRSNRQLEGHYKPHRSTDFFVYTTTRCRLLELPAELRNRIYRFSLVEPDQIYVPINDKEIRRFYKHPLRGHGPYPREPPLLDTCRQIRLEAMGIYCSENVFNIWLAVIDFPRWRNEAGIKWMISKGKRKQKLMKRLEVHIHCASMRAQPKNEDAVIEVIRQTLKLISPHTQSATISITASYDTS